MLRCALRLVFLLLTMSFRLNLNPDNMVEIEELRGHGTGKVKLSVLS
jgi:hypothetical protein